MWSKVLLDGKGGSEKCLRRFIAHAVGGLLATIIAPMKVLLKQQWLNQRTTKEIYILMEFKEVQVRRMSLVNEH